MVPYAQTNLALLEEARAAGWDDDARHALSAAWDLACALFGGQFRSNGKPLLCHLAGTASILLRHGAGPETVTAGLMHAAYPLGDFGDGRSAGSRPRGQRARPERRVRLRRGLGDAVEERVLRYARLRWDGLRPEEAAERVARGDVLDRDVLLMRAANTLEDCLDAGAAHSSPETAAGIVASLPKAEALARALGADALAEALGRAAALTAAQLAERGVRDERPRGTYRVRAAAPGSDAGLA